MSAEELRLFVDDAVEVLDEADRAALRLDEALHAGRTPPAEALHALFRCVHTLKGNAGIMDLAGCVAIAHALEGGLDRLRAGALALDPDRVNHLFAGLDALRTLVGALTTPGAPPLDAAAVAARLDALLGEPADAAAPVVDLDARFPGWTLAAEPARRALARRLAAGEEDLYHLRWPAAAGPEGPEADDAFERLRALGAFVAWRPDPAVAEGLEGAYLSRATAEEVARFGPAGLTGCEPFRAAGPARDGAAVGPRAQLDGDAPEAAPRPGPGEPGDGSIRVGTAQLDTLMNLMGELVLTRNQILRHMRGHDDPALLRPVQRLNLLATELQEAVMRTRMQPIGQAWDKLPRLVRDYCQATGKQAQVVLEGGETELDKSLLEAIKDPLTHLVRNAVDHGLEAPDVRAAAGKDPRGTVRLAARQEGGQVLLEVSDDGRGLDHARIRDKARALGLVDADALAHLPDAEIARLIFNPGFSTAPAVTSISGRGVGMDVVKANLERVGGTIDLEAVPGGGTAFRLRIPLTLAVIPALVVFAGGERFALPQAGVREVVRAGGGGPGIERVHDAPVFRLRDALVPVVPLGRTLGLAGGAADAPTEDPEAAVPLVIVQAGGRSFALAVDAIGDPEEIVVKPLHRFLHGTAAYAGVTIMGDGRPSMILDVAGLAAVAGLAPAAAAPEAPAARATHDSDRPRMLLCSLGDRTFGVPMAQVARLEEFAAERVERLGGRLVVQYGEGLLPVIAPEAMLGLAPQAAAATTSVVVLQAGAAQAGLRVHGITDIVEVAAAPRPVAGVPGVAAAAVIGGRATEILDVAALLEEVRA